MTWIFFQWKCRLCCKTYEAGATPDRNAAGMALVYAMDPSLGQRPTFFTGQKITLHTRHQCGGGAVGVADLLGFVEREAQDG